MFMVGSTKLNIFVSLVHKPGKSIFEDVQII